MNQYEKDTQNPLRMQSMILDRQQTVELAEDFSLPDYQPEIKRLLRVKATIQPADRYIGSGSAECSGTVDYCILYSGNDGAIYSTNQSGEYRFTVPMDIPADVDAGDGFVCDVDLQPELASGRVISPRRLAVKCRMRAGVKMYATRTLCESVGEGEHLQKLHGESACARIFLGSSEPIALADEILCEQKDQNLRVICGEGQVFVTEAVAGSGAVNARGEVCLKLLCCREEEGEEPFAMWRRIPFSDMIPVDGVEVNCETSVWGSCSELHVTVEEGRILCEIALLLHSMAQRNERFSYVRDLYSTERDCKVSYQTLEMPIALRTINGNFSLNTALSLEEAGIRPNCSLVDLTGTATVQSMTQERGKYLIGGKCRLHAILSDSGEMSSQELEVPFRYETDAAEGEPVENNLRVEVISCKGKIDGERIGVDAELAVFGTVRGKSTIQAVCGAELGEPWQERGAVYTVCYPASDDTLWSVARRYHRSVEELLARNSLASSPAADARDSLMGVNFLVV